MWLRLWVVAGGAGIRSRAEDSEAVGYLRLVADFGAWKQLGTSQWSYTVVAAEGEGAAAAGSRLTRQLN